MTMQKPEAMDDSAPNVLRRPWPSRGSRAWRALAVAGLVGVANGVAWIAAHPEAVAPEVAASRPLAGVAYSPFGRRDDPGQGRLPGDREIRADLALLRDLTPQIRTYSASEWPGLPAAAAAAGLRMTAGVWLGADDERNQRELNAIVNTVREVNGKAGASGPLAIERVIAGNETLLQKKLAYATLVDMLERLRRTLGVPVSTAEPWHVWMDNPQLVRHVDFITVHLLPYWDGVPHTRAVDQALLQLRQVQQRYPGKAILIGEFGWPSGGDAVPGSDAVPGTDRLRKARPLTGNPGTEAHATPQAQAMVLREFVARQPREAPGVEYFLIEAFDQPWKSAIEGAAGAHWGLFDAARSPKFSFTGAVPANGWWPQQAAVATAVGMAFAAAAAWVLPRLALAPLLAVMLAAQALLSIMVALAGRPLLHYLLQSQWLAWLLFAATLALLAAVWLVQALEFAELYWRGQLRSRYPNRPWPPELPPLHVSVHLPCCNEPPEMVIAAIDSLHALEHPPGARLEILVIDNNTRDPALWQPVRDHVERLTAAAQRPHTRLRFFHLASWPGYKAGALNFALRETDPAAQVVAVVDADYIVQPDWLQRLLGHFADPLVAVVQSPQAHRCWQHDLWRRCMNWEYEGFFRLGMHHRNERGAIIQHGTVTLIRAQSLREAEGWDENCVCEDTELGLRLLERGWRAIYVDQDAGRGLTPDDFAAYKSQRQRWAQGAMQILRGHARALLLPGRLSLAQRYHFVAGWLPWWADAMHLLFTLGAIAWSAGLLLWPDSVRLPDPIYLLPALMLPGLRLLMTPLLYQRRVGCKPIETAGAMLAGIALSHAVARGVFAGLFSRHARFVVTRKGQEARPGVAPAPLLLPRKRTAGPPWPVSEEATLLLALAGAALAVFTLQAAPTPAAHAGWLWLLGALSLPYIAALACQALATRKKRPALGLVTGAQPQLAPPEE